MRRLPAVLLCAMLGASVASCSRSNGGTGEAADLAPGGEPPPGGGGGHPDLAAPPTGSVDLGASDLGSLSPSSLSAGKQGFTAAGARSSSSRFTVISSTGQATPVPSGASSSPRFTHAPGIVGGP